MRDAVVLREPVARGETVTANAVTTEQRWLSTEDEPAASLSPASTEKPTDSRTGSTRNLAGEGCTGRFSDGVVA